MKTSRLSLATALALGLTASSLSAANTDLIDIPLRDGNWTFIGVKSGFSETAASGSMFDTNVFDISEIEIIDDNLSTAVHGSESEGNITVAFWVIDHNSNMEYSSAKMYVRDRKSDETNILNEMYVYSDDTNTTPSIRIRYQAQYETDNFYLELNGSANVYEGTFESQSDYDAPQKLTQLSGSGMASDENLSINYVWDLNISNNPGKNGVAGTKKDYTAENYRDEVTDDQYADTTISIYNYNSAATTWETCITDAGSDDLSSCDFQEFESGKGYWVKVDNEDQSGLILGDGIITADKYDLTNGWNMLALNDYDIAPKGGTGLLVELNVSGGHTKAGVGGTNFVFIIEDSEGTNSLELNSSPYTFGDLGIDDNITIGDITQVFNKQIGLYQKDQNLSKTFNIRFYPTKSSNIMFIASDSKFRIKEERETFDYIREVNTTADERPISLSSGSRETITDLDEVGVSSVFGETALGLVHITDGFADVEDYDKVVFNKYNGTGGDTEIAYTTASTDLDGTTNSYISNSFYIDTNFDGVIDTNIVADENGTNFSVQDKTFTRKYSVVAKANHASAATLDIDLEQNRTSEVYANIFTPSTSQIAHKIENATNKPTTYDLEATDDGNDTIYVISKNTDFKNFAINQSDKNETILKLVSGEGDDNASGIVREVYTLANLAQAKIDTASRHKIRFESTNFNSTPGDYDSKKDYYVEMNISNFSNLEDGSLSTLKHVDKKYARLRFGVFNEVNTTARRDARVDAGDAFYMSVGGTMVTVNYKNMGSFVDVNTSVYPSDLNSSGATTGGNLATLWAAGINRFFTDYNTSFNITASTSTDGPNSDTLVLFGDFNLTIDANHSFISASKDNNITIADSNQTKVGDKGVKNGRVFDSNLSIPTEIPNLTYEKVYAGRMNTDIDNPLSVIQRKTADDGTNYKITKILTTNENPNHSSGNGAISWNFIDMTKYSSGWFDDNDPYNIFSFYGEKGYWVFLDGGYTNPLDGIDSGDITSSIFKYSHEFTSDANSTASSPNDETINWKKNTTMTTTNTMYDGSVTVDVGDMIDSSKVDRAILEIAGEVIPMTKSGNEYSATFSEYQLEDFGTDSTLDINVSFFTTDFFSKTIGMVLDNEAPTRPTITINDVYLTDVTFSSSPDTTYFHIYENDINDSKPISFINNSANTLVDYNITADGTTGLATGYNFCATVQNFNDNLGLYQFIAVDGIENSGYTVGDEYYGDIYYNRASDVGYIPDSNNSYPIYKNASIYQVPANGSDRVPVLYGSDCKTESMTQLVNDDYGFSATSLDGAEFNISIETEDSTPALAETGVDSLATVKVAVDNTVIGKVQFNVNYYTNHTQPFLVAYNGAIYKTDFAILEENSTKGTDSDLGTINLTDANKTNLTGQAILGSD
jgi:hypothetical protein